MSKAQKRSATLVEKFWFRKNITSASKAATNLNSSNDDDSYTLMSIDEIINGKVIFRYCARAVKKLSYYHCYFSDWRIPRSYSVDSQLSVWYGSGHGYPLHHSTVPETNIATRLWSNRHDCELDTALCPRTCSVQVCYIGCQLFLTNVCEALIICFRLCLDTIRWSMRKSIMTFWWPPTEFSPVAFLVHSYWVIGC